MLILRSLNGNVSDLSALFFERVHCDSSESPLNLIEAVAWIDRAYWL